MGRALSRFYCFLQRGLDTALETTDLDTLDKTDWMHLTGWALLRTLLTLIR